MARKSKHLRSAYEDIDVLKTYDLSAAIKILKDLSSKRKFDETIELALCLGIDPRQSDQMVRGTCPLPHGSGKQVRVLVFAQGEAATAANNAGAEFVGYDDMITKIQGGFQDFDVAVATPEAMAEVRKLGRFLGPRGLMPNPKTGTLTDDTASAVTAVKAGRIDFKMDRSGNLSAPIGKLSFTPDQLSENGDAVLKAIRQVKPASAKGIYFCGATLSATVSPGIPIETSGYEK